VDNDASVFMNKLLDSRHIFIHFACQWTSSTDVTPLLNSENRSNVSVLLIVSSQQAYFNISKVSVAVFPSLKRNLMNTRCSLKSATFWWSRNRNGHDILSHFTRYYLSMTQATTLK
jgi:hypothetical protein